MLIAIVAKKKKTSRVLVLLDSTFLVFNEFYSFATSRHLNWFSVTINWIPCITRIISITWLVRKVENSAKSEKKNKFYIKGHKCYSRNYISSFFFFHFPPSFQLILIRYTLDYFQWWRRKKREREETKEKQTQIHKVKWRGNTWNRAVHRLIGVRETIKFQLTLLNLWIRWVREIYSNRSTTTMNIFAFVFFVFIEIWCGFRNCLVMHETTWNEQI